MTTPGSEYQDQGALQQPQQNVEVPVDPTAEVAVAVCPDCGTTTGEHDMSGDHPPLPYPD